MRDMAETERRHDEARAHIHTTIASEFCEVINRTGLPPMAVLRFAAQAIGTIYREAAKAHSGVDACPCGWRPQMQADIEVLSAALCTAGKSESADGLLAMQTAGTA